MGQDQLSVALRVCCGNVGDDSAAAPKELTLTITPPVMEVLEKLIVYGQLSRELFLQQLPDSQGRYYWDGVEVLFQHFAPTCLVENPDYDPDDEGAIYDYDDHLNIGCKRIRLQEDGVVLRADLLGALTELRSDLIPYPRLQEKFRELRMLMESAAIQEGIEGVVDRVVEGVRLSTEGKSSLGMPL